MTKQWHLGNARFRHLIEVQHATPGLNVLRVKKDIQIVVANNNDTFTLAEAA